MKKSNLETGIELIAKERQEQLEKHCISILDDVQNNGRKELSKGAIVLRIFCGQ